MRTREQLLTEQNKARADGKIQEFFDSLTPSEEETLESTRQEALQKLQSLRPVSGTDPDYQYPKDTPARGQH